MKPLLVTLTAIGSVLFVTAISTAEDLPDGWVSLFDGKTLDGWKQLAGTAPFVVDEGTILGTTKKGSPNSFLCTEKLYDDFELEFEVKLDPRLNSGVQIRSQSSPDYLQGRVYGYQVEISTNGNAGFIYDEGRRGWLSDVSDNQERVGNFNRNGWNQFRVVCEGPSIKVWLNGVPCADLVDDKTPKGFIGLQIHSFRGASPAWVRWRNIRIRQVSDIRFR